MPRKNGRQALLEIKADPGLKSIPLAIFTISDSEECLQLSRDFRCTYLKKPDRYEGWVKAMGIALTTELPKTDTSYPSPHQTLSPPHPNSDKMPQKIQLRFKRSSLKKAGT